MENAAIRKSKITKIFLESLNTVYNAPYSPDWNPIRNSLGILKKEFRRLNINIEKNILLNILKSFKSFPNMYLYYYFCNQSNFKISHSKKSLFELFFVFFSLFKKKMNVEKIIL